MTTLEIVKSELTEYVLVNSTIFAVAILQYLTIYYQVFGITHFLWNLLFFFFKDYLIMLLIMLRNKDKEYIHGHDTSPVCIYSLTSICYVLSAAFIEATGMFLAVEYIDFPADAYKWDLLSFIYVSFFVEIFFDFFHYWMHRWSHTNKYLYRLHKDHHLYKYPTIITTYYQHPLDLILSNIVPSLIAIYLIRVSLFQLTLITTYKTFIELGGHVGKKLAPTSSFPQLPWLPRFLGIALYAEDHDIHHTHVVHNFAKRFSLWDRVFGTFISHTDLKA